MMWTERRSGPLLKRSIFDHRSAYERDKTRVIHCPAFRRLQRKTQILGTGKGDFHRTRLTHSLEVASIGVSIVRHLHVQHQGEALLEHLPTDDLITVICLIHDIGHPPFGHGGEVALNYMMREYGGFESNGQTLRLLTKIETSYGTFGLDLTRRTLLGILKYPVVREQVVAKILPPSLNPTHTLCINRWIPPKAYFATEQTEVDWLLAALTHDEKQLFQTVKTPPTDLTHGYSAYQSLDCSIMNIADDIAYGVHDLEDAIHLHLIQREQLETATFKQLVAQTPLHHSAQLLTLLFHPEIHQRKEAIGELVNYLITSTYLTIQEAAFQSPLLKYQATLREEAQRLLQHLVSLVYQHVIDAPTARTFEFGGQTIIFHLFDALSANPNSLLEKPYRILYATATDQSAAYRLLCDYIANMTDEYAHRLHERLFGWNVKSPLDF